MGIFVYRIVQEALTNVRTHAAGTRAQAALRYMPNHVEVDASGQTRLTVNPATDSSPDAQ